MTGKTCEVVGCHETAKATRVQVLPNIRCLLYLCKEHRSEAKVTALNIREAPAIDELTPREYLVKRMLEAAATAGGKIAAEKHPKALLHMKHNALLLAITMIRDLVNDEEFSRQVLGEAGE